jgi:hypothetical protein
LALLLLLAGSMVLLAANAQYASAQSDTGDLFGDGAFEDLIVNGTYANENVGLKMDYSPEARSALTTASSGFHKSFRNST